jgi:hypothetical protein
MEILVEAATDASVIGWITNDSRGRSGEIRKGRGVVVQTIAVLLTAVRLRGITGPAAGLADVPTLPPSPLPVRPATGVELPAAMAGPPAPPPFSIVRPLPRMTSLPTRVAAARPSPSSLGNRSGLRNTASGRWTRPINTNRPTAGGGHAEASALSQP